MAIRVVNVLIRLLDRAVQRRRECRAGGGSYSLVDAADAADVNWLSSSGGEATSGYTAVAIIIFADVVASTDVLALGVALGIAAPASIPTLLGIVGCSKIIVISKIAAIVGCTRTIPVADYL